MFVLAAALCGLGIILSIQLKHLKLRIKPLGRRQEDLQKELKKTGENGRQDGWTIVWENEKFNIKLNSPCPIWYISLFQTKIVKLNIDANLLGGNLLYKFSSSMAKSEKIMTPIYRKVQTKYYHTSDPDLSIKIVRQKPKDTELPIYTWLKNTAQIHTALFHFLEEFTFIAKEIQVTPSVVLYIGEKITCEIDVPHENSLLLWQQRINNIFGVECLKEENSMKLILWIAFSEHNIPYHCLKNYPYSYGPQLASRAS